MKYFISTKKNDKEYFLKNVNLKNYQIMWDNIPTNAKSFKTIEEAQKYLCKVAMLLYQAKTEKVSIVGYSNKTMEELEELLGND